MVGDVACDGGAVGAAVAGIAPSIDVATTAAAATMAAELARLIFMFASSRISENAF
jgi:hypothetical protein